MVMRGSSLRDVKGILGHADMKMTLRDAHLSPAHLRAAVDRLDGLTPIAALAADDAAVQHTGQRKTGKVASTAP